MMKLSYLEELTAHWPTQAALRMVLGFIYQYLNGDCHAEFTQWEDLRRQHVKCTSLSFSNTCGHILFIKWSPLVYLTNLKCSLNLVRQIAGFLILCNSSSARTSFATIYCSTSIKLYLNKLRSRLNLIILLRTVDFLPFLDERCLAHHIPSRTRLT